MNHRGSDPDGGRSGFRRTLRTLLIGLTVPLVGAALLWWVSGSDIGQARWIAIGVIVVALAGWHFSSNRKSS